MAQQIEPVSVTEADVHALDFGQLARLVGETTPDRFYAAANAFDSAAHRVQQLRDDLRRESRDLQESMRGRLRQGVEEVTRRQLASIDALLEGMHRPGYAHNMRRAGDALALSQQRVSDLLQQKNENAVAPAPVGILPEQLALAQQQDEQHTQQARQIVLDLGAAYRDVGLSLAPQGGSSGGGAITTGSPGAPAMTVPAAGVPAFPHGHRGVGTGVKGEVGTDKSAIASQGERSAVGLGQRSAIPEPAGNTQKLLHKMSESGLFEGGSDGAACFGVLGRGKVPTAGAHRGAAVAKANSRERGESEKRQDRKQQKASLAAYHQVETSTGDAGPQTSDADRSASAAQPSAEAATSAASRSAAPSGKLPMSVAMPSVTAGEVDLAASGGTPALPLRLEEGGTAGLPEKRSVSKSDAAGTFQSLSGSSALPPGEFTAPVAQPAMPSTAGSAPMMMGMGGMRAGSGQHEGERYAEVPVVPDHEVWESKSTQEQDGVLGRPVAEADEPPVLGAPDLEGLRDQALELILGRDSKRRQG
jgi:hypothetical protein